MLRRTRPMMTVVAALVSILVGCTCAVSSSEPVGQDAEYERVRVTYRNAETVLSGILWLPRNPGPHPALVIVDGSGKTRAERLEAWMEVLVDSGFTCLDLPQLLVDECSLCRQLVEVGLLFFVRGCLGKSPRAYRCRCLHSRSTARKLATACARYRCRSRRNCQHWQSVSA